MLAANIAIGKRENRSKLHVQYAPTLSLSAWFTRLLPRDLLVVKFACEGSSCSRGPRRAAHWHAAAALSYVVGVGDSAWLWPVTTAFGTTARTPAGE